MPLLTNCQILERSSLVSKTAQREVVRTWCRLRKTNTPILARNSRVRRERAPRFRQKWKRSCDETEQRLRQTRYRQWLKRMEQREQRGRNCSRNERQS